MRIVHLTDIHLSKDTLKDFKQFYVKALLNDLKEFHDQEKIDLILISGDLADKGGQSFIAEKEDPYEVFNSEFVDPIIDVLNLSYDNVFIAPGNHDVCESKIEQLVESGMLSTHKSIEVINKYVDDNANSDHIGLKRINDFKTYEKKLAVLRENIVQDISNFESNYSMKVSGTIVSINCLNSAWRCSSKLPKDDLTFGTRQILNADEFNNKNRSEFNIVLLHHPTEFISSVERIEAENLLQSLNFNLLLCGHIHESHSHAFFGSKGRIYINIAKTAFGNPREKIENFKPGYCIIDILNSSDETVITSHFRKYVHTRLKFDKDVDAAEDGKYICPIKSNSSLSEFNKLVALTNTTYISKLDNINTSLLIHGTDSIAPNDINQLFVLPNLTDSITKYDVLNKDVEENIKYFGLEDLLLLKQNILIIGERESGKTTLLNKIFVDCSNGYHKYNLIAVKFNFQDIIKKEIKPIIRDFLNGPNGDEIEVYLKNGQILLIIDDFDNQDKFEYAKSKLKNFIRLFPNNKIIVSTSIQLDELVTEEETIFGSKPTDKKHTEFKPIFIGSVGAKHFRELSSKWFQRKDSIWIQKNLEKLIKVFAILKTPRTFFSISLFLWIIEKQESFRPVNKANLVYRFLLLILKGLKIEESEAGKYTFEKKVEILRELALEMYENGDALEEYSLLKEDVIKCIKRNFTLNQLKLDETEKFQELLDKGLLKKVNGGDHFAFRYEAFFQYFLSLNINKDDNFKAKVYSDDNFLSFIDELDYHTGSLRDDIKTLDFCFEKLNGSFELLDDYMTENIDEYLPKAAFFAKNPNLSIDNLKKDKFSDSQIEENLGEQLEMLPVQDSIRVKQTVNAKHQFHQALELAARVLKNSENIQSPDAINKYLDIVINKTGKYGIFIQSILLDNIEKQKDAIPFPTEALIAIAPIINQDLLLKWLGTDFLEVPLENKIKSYLLAKENEYSEYELFLTMFLYFDLQLSGYLDYVEKSVEKINSMYIKELFLIKVFHHYMMRSNNSSTITKLESILVLLISKLKNISKKSARLQIEKIRDDKEKFKEQSNN